MNEMPFLNPTRPWAALLWLAPWLAYPVGELGAQEWKEFRTSRQAADYRSVEVEVMYGAGRLHIFPAQGNSLYDVRMRFDAARFAPLRSWTEQNGHGKLRVALTSIRSDSDEDLASEARLDHFEVKLELSDLRKLGDSAGQLDVELSRTVPTELTIKVGAAQSAMELGGVPLTRLELVTGASETRLSFDEPNPARMESLDIRVGAASFQAEELGNADFERFSFRGGVGDVTLDFGGEWQRNARVDVKMGVGSLTLRIPRSLGVRIRKQSFLAAFNAPGLDRTPDGFQTPNWEDAETQLIVELETAFGSVKIERIP